MASSCLRRHNYVRVGANGPGDGQRTEAHGPFVPLAVGAYIMSWGTMGGPFEGLHEPRTKFWT